MTCSFLVTHVNTHKLYRKETAMRVGAIPSHASLTQKIDISDSRTVVQYVECPN